MEKIEAPSLNQFITELTSTNSTQSSTTTTTTKTTIENNSSLNNEKKQILIQVAGLFGSIVAQLHNSCIIHGDLTTSNVLIETKNNDEKKNDFSLIMIDFGIGCVSTMIEDKAVDLYVMSRAIASTHAALENLLVDAFFVQYKKEAQNAKEIVARYEEVTLRGRKKGKQKKEGGGNCNIDEVFFLKKNK